MYLLSVSNRSIVPVDAMSCVHRSANSECGGGVVGVTLIEQDQGVAIDCDAHRQIGFGSCIVILLPAGLAMNQKGIRSW